jgi:hypothetical protein
VPECIGGVKPEGFMLRARFLASDPLLCEQVRRGTARSENTRFEGPRRRGFTGGRFGPVRGGPAAARGRAAGRVATEPAQLREERGALLQQVHQLGLDAGTEVPDVPGARATVKRGPREPAAAPGRDAGPLAGRSPGI